jgi:cyanophycinase
MSMEHKSARGFIIPIGGREEKEVNPRVLERFVQLSGGKDAIISVIPTASNLEDTGDRYVEIFQRLGVKKIYNNNISSRLDANNEIFVKQLTESTGIFMTGGNQLLLSTVLGGTVIAKMIRKRNAEGVPVAGTSAGAAFIPEHMIVSGDSGLIPRVGGVMIAPGLGLTNKIMIDQHFSQRNRLGRLLTALSYNPYKTGVGVDEDTAAIIDAEGNIEAIGSGALTVVDMSKVEFSSVASTSPGEAISLVGVKIHTLLSGDRYNTKTHEVIQLIKEVLE